MKTRITAGSVLCLLALSFSVAGQFPAKRTVNEVQGFSFQNPEGWRVVIDMGYGLANPAGVIGIKGHQYADMKAFLDDANLVRDRVSLLGAPQDTKGGKYFRSVQQDSGLVVDTFVLFSPFGGGIVVVGVAEKGQLDNVFKKTLEVADSVEFFRPKEQPIAQQVRAALAGKLLTYLYTGNGYSERMDIVLCGSGTAYRSTDMGGFSPGSSDGASFAALSRKAGTWNISADGATLNVVMNSGGTFAYKLAARPASNEITMNGKRFFVQAQTVCK